MSLDQAGKLVMQCFAVLLVVLPILKYLNDARDRKYESIEELKNERIEQLSGEVKLLQRNIGELKVELEREFKRRRDAECQILQMEHEKKGSQERMIELLTENRELRIKIDRYERQERYHEPTNS